MRVISAILNLGNIKFEDQLKSGKKACKVNVFKIVIQWWTKFSEEDKACIGARNTSISAACIYFRLLGLYLVLIWWVVMIAFVRHWWWCRWSGENISIANMQPACCKSMPKLWCDWSKVCLCIYVRLMCASLIEDACLLDWSILTVILRTQ